MLPERLAAAGISGPDVGRLRREGRLGAVRLADVSVPRPGQSFALVMDTAVCEGAEELAAGATMAVVESTFADDAADLAAAYLHLTAGQAGAVAAHAGTLVLTHFSSRYGDVGPLVDQARATAGSADVVAAADLDRLALPPRRPA
jgi:ribonuclease Z